MSRSGALLGRVARHGGLALFAVAAFVACENPTEACPACDEEEHHGNVAGTVRDTLGAPVAATVTLVVRNAQCSALATNVAIAPAEAVETNSAGSYSFNVTVRGSAPVCLRVSAHMPGRIIGAVRDSVMFSPATDPLVAVNLTLP